jgi:hypothetical protein
MRFVHLEKKAHTIELLFNFGIRPFTDVFIVWTVLEGNIDILMIGLTLKRTSLYT